MLRERKSVGQLPSSQPPARLEASHNRQDILGLSEEPHCPVILLIDTSSEISGELLSRLHEGLTTFKQEIVRDVIASRRLQVAVITFNDGARLSQGFAPINLHIPLQLNAEGATAMGQGLTLMLNELQALEARYHSNNVNFHTPWVFLIIGSRPTDSWEQAAQRVRDAVEAKQLNFFVVGIRGADMMMLRQVAHPSQSPIMIDGLKFQEMFHWLADSMKQVACSDVGSAVDLSPTTGWARVS